jgi:hypothetical protein
LPFYRNILFNCPVAGCSTTTTTASTGQTATDPINNAINNLGQIAAFSALPFYRNILFNLPVGSVGPPITTALTAQGNETNVPPTLSPSLPGSGATTTPGTGWTRVPHWSPPQNNDQSGTENEKSDPVVVTAATGGTNQPENSPRPFFKRDAPKSTADTQLTSGNKVEPKRTAPWLLPNGSRGGAENGMFSGLNGLGGLFGGGKDQASSPDNKASTSGGAATN